MRVTGLRHGYVGYGFAGLAVGLRLRRRGLGCLVQVLGAPGRVAGVWCVWCGGLAGRGRARGAMGFGLAVEGF